MRVAVVGGSGFTGQELLRLLSTHPEFDVVAATSRSRAGEPVDHAFPNLNTDLTFIDPADLPDADIYFTAVPHTVAMNHVPGLLDRGRVVDLSADYRLPAATYEKWYDTEHVAPRDAVYGLTELHRDEIPGADLVANPGCYPTGATLAAKPLFDHGYADTVVFDSKSGISGAGATPSGIKMYTRVAENIRAYSTTRHRHLAEMKQELMGRVSEGRSSQKTSQKTPQESSSASSRVHFTPHVMPSIRGILTTAHVFLNEEPDDLRGLYEDYYGDDHFIRIRDEPPEPRDVRGSNYVHIGGFETSGNRAVVVSAIDNLVKGASGAAVQNANLMAGLPEETGLEAPGMSP